MHLQMYFHTQQIRIRNIAQITTVMMTVGMVVRFLLSESQYELYKQKPFKQQVVLQSLSY